MASPAARTATDENVALAKAVSIATDKMGTRRVLGDVSPNVKMASPATGMLKNKPTTGSPLKRSFTAMVEDGAGLTYLKRRRLSDEESLGQTDGVIEPSRSVCSGGGSRAADEVVGFRPLQAASPDETEGLAIPTVQEPSPTEPNTPSDSDEGTQHSSAERKSFSSLINYDPSSQMTNLHLTSTSRAEMLRLRLRVAMYKVRTNQINTPFSQLKMECRSSPKPTSQAVEEAVAALRREAQQTTPLSDQPFPKLLAAPVLKPTAYSSRMIYQPLLPSSPPVSRSPERKSLPQQIATPARAVSQLSSPPDSAGRLGRREEAELTSSVVKGRVAEGLLGLRNAA
ncbi:hypothetical protein LTR85_000569 [Meristemomyces frigidus]|nr:hypothetical protein LTR85_000569 [Meristemomyces frigidus]